MTTRRPLGSGSIEPLPSGRARVRVRVPGEGKRSLGTFATEGEAREVLDAHLFAMAATGDAGSSGVMTLRALGRRFLAYRELQKVRGVGIERNRWTAHIDTAYFANWPLGEITARDVRKWRDEMSAKKSTKVAAGGTRTEPKRVRTRDALSRSAVKNTLNLLRVAFAYAVEEDLIDANPAYGVKLARELRTDDPWTYLHPDEQSALINCEAIPYPERLILRFAIGTGMRKGELWSLRRSDVDTTSERPHVLVRFGSPGKPPKNGRKRRVPLFGHGIEAAKAWLLQLPKYAKRNPLGLMFPTRRGYCRHGRIIRAAITGRPGMRWTEMVRAAGITRRVRFHDLRHTCGSSLVAGWWGRAWTLVEVRDLLGHSAISVTERYAHLAQSALEEAAYATALSVPTLAHAANSAQTQEER